MSDKVSLDGDRSNKGRLLNILIRIGTIENIDQLTAYSDKVFGNNYGSDLIYYDQCGAIEALEAILKRTTDPEMQEKIKRAQNTINSNLTNHGHEPISESAIASMNVEPQTLVRDFEDLFRDRSFVEESDLRFENWLDNPRFDEDMVDNQIEADYRASKFEEVESRLETVKRLRHEAKKEKNIKEDPEEDDTKFLRRHFLEYREENPSPYTPTLGIEIEIREKSLNLPKNKEGYYDSSEIRGKFGKTEELDVPRRYDKFWEFAHEPARYYHTLSREVQALIEMCLINKENTKHPLHLTIGRVGAGEDDLSSALLFARALEATGWSTRGGRLLRPYYVKRGTWEIKGTSGIKNREPDKLALGVKLGFEIRTFQLQSLAGLDRLLRSAFLLGAALRAFQHKRRDLPFDSDAGNIIRDNLANIWEDFYKQSVAIFGQFNLPEPDLVWKTPDCLSEKWDSEFVFLARMPDQAKENPESDWAKFVSEMRKLIIETRAKIAKIIYPKNNDQKN